MKKLLILSVIVFAVASCSTIKVTSDYDKTAGFATYKTYMFTDEAMNLPVDELNRKRLITAVEKELSVKGFTKVESNPDVIIDLRIKAEQKQTATATTTGGYGYRYGWRGGYSSTSINYDTYTDGTLFIDMIDAAQKQLVWEGRGTKTLNPDASPEKKEANINYAVTQIFTKYPPKF